MLNISNECKIVRRVPTYEHSAYGHAGICNYADRQLDRQIDKGRERERERERAEERERERERD